MRKLAIGVDIGGTNIKAGLVDSKGQVVSFKKVPTNAFKGFNEVFKSMVRIINDFVREVKKDNICGIGCATAGQVNHTKGKVVFATDNIPGLSGFELKKELEEHFNYPIDIENDVNALAIGEAWLGVAKDVNDFICLTLGTGIGGAIFKNGKIDHGSSGIAGEFGHMIINYDGVDCNCGNKGCFEQYGSVSALINNFKSYIIQGYESIVLDMVDGNLNKINGEVIFEAQKNGDKLSTKIINDYINYLSIGIINLIHILNPKMVVIGGGITSVGHNLFDLLNKNVRNKAMPEFTKNLSISPALLGNIGGIVGITKNFFEK